MTYSSSKTEDDTTKAKKGHYPKRCLSKITWGVLWESLKIRKQLTSLGKKGKIQLVVIKRKGQTTHSKGTTMRLEARFKDEDWWIKSDLSILVPEWLCRQALLWQTQKPENSLLMGKGEIRSVYPLEVNVSKWVYFLHLKYMQLERSKLKLHNLSLLLGFKRTKMLNEEGGPSE